MFCPYNLLDSRSHGSQRSLSKVVVFEGCDCGMIRLCGCYFCEGVTSKIVLTEDVARGLQLVSFQNLAFHRKWERRGTIMQVHFDCKGRNSWPRKPVDLHQMEGEGKWSGDDYRSRSVRIQWMQRWWHDECHWHLLWPAPPMQLWPATSSASNWLSISSSTDAPQAAVAAAAPSAVAAAPQSELVAHRHDAKWVVTMAELCDYELLHCCADR